MTEYVSLEKGEELLVRALNLANKLGHEVWIKNYDAGFEREEGEPDYCGFEFDEIIVEDSIEPDAMPEYAGDGCNDVIIEIKDGAEQTEICVWYQDDQEDRIYTDEIRDYLLKYDPENNTN
ncbi:hypothetical protein bpr_II106 (plasmid) [Butyrivibrio proteoclasticus B316]|uniref:Uncharacterized protein n=1 Tax=Butyrivibrio proteoclasticus (strain ATCC 51982 / DSM 14932 / B316) TaxID=515622 RepID=E0S3R3_BUTPB|nr:hypothetical protein [Butyrivibrio proteoclasticus]ADL36045.1 hypothetical protein bpr_II106 [Butyrivibrio proteoclasticus B316]